MEVFSRYVSALLEERATDDDHRQIIDTLRQHLVWELRRRGIYQESPRFLGVDGAQRWTRDALDELALDAYEHIFLDRGGSLLAARRVDRPIEGAVRLSLRQFVGKRQEEADWLGALLFRRLKKAVGSLHREGTLERAAGVESRTGEALHAALLCFEDAGSAETASGDALDELLEGWPAELLLDLARAYQDTSVVSALASELRGLRLSVDCFEFRTLSSSLRHVVRRRWRGVVHHELELAGGQEIGPEDDIREIVETLRECLSRQIESERRESTREDLRKILDELLAWFWADEWGETAPVPSSRILARRLGLAKTTVDRRQARLRELAVKCLKEPEESDGETGSGAPRGGDSTVMDDRDSRNEARRAELFQRSLELAAREAPADAVRDAVTAETDADADASRAAGTLLLLPSAILAKMELDVHDTAAMALEAVFWLVLTVDERARSVELVPIDSAPWVGRDDLPLADGLEHHVVRGGVRRAIGLDRLDDATVVDRLDAERLAAIRRSLEGLSEPAGSARERDPDLAEWLEQLEDFLDALVAGSVVDTVTPDPGGAVGGDAASADAVGHGPVESGSVHFLEPRTSERSPQRSSWIPWALAAALGVLAIGLAIVGQRYLERAEGLERLVAARDQQIDQLQQSTIEVLADPFALIELGATVRSAPDVVEARDGGPSFRRIEVALSPDHDVVGTRVELLGPDGAIVATTGRIVDRETRFLAVSISDRHAPSGSRLTLRWLGDDGEVIDSTRVVVP